MRLVWNRVVYIIYLYIISYPLILSRENVS